MWFGLHARKSSGTAETFKYSKEMEVRENGFERREVATGKEIGRTGMEDSGKATAEDMVESWDENYEQIASGWKKYKDAKTYKVLAKTLYMDAKTLSKTDGGSGDNLILDLASMDEETKGKWLAVLMNVGSQDPETDRVLEDKLDSMDDATMAKWLIKESATNSVLKKRGSQPELAKSEFLQNLNGVLPNLMGKNEYLNLPHANQEKLDELEKEFDEAERLYKKARTYWWVYIIAVIVGSFSFLIVVHIHYEQWHTAAVLDEFYSESHESDDETIESDDGSDGVQVGADGGFQVEADDDHPDWEPHSEDQAEAYDPYQ
jgi:hypothetical protein